MRNVFITSAGQVTFEKTEKSIAAAKMHCTNPLEYRASAAEASYNAYSVKDIEQMNREWAYRCKQSPYGGKTQFWFEDLTRI